MILLRGTRTDDALELFADALQSASGERVALLLDERRGHAGATRFDKIGLTVPACHALGLHTPGDVGWRCGDYGFYLARSRYPEERHFWMIDYDVRISGDAGQFFAQFAARPEIDVVAARLSPTNRDWWWCATVAARDVAPYRCFFPVVRLSARAIDRLHSKRRAHSRNPLRRALWPNDEAFVATTAVAAGLSTADLNGLGPRFYDDATFSYDHVIDGDRLVDDDPAPRLHHPVLFGENYSSKVARTHREQTRNPIHERAWRKLVATANGKTRW